MKRKELSARLLAGALSFSMAASLCAPSLTAFAAEENQVAAEEAVADETDIPAEEQGGAVSENAEEGIAAEENAADVSDSENESDAEETETSAEDTENTDAEGSEEEEAGSEEVQEASEEAVPDVTDETEASTYEEEPSDEAEAPAADGQEEGSSAEEVPEESAEEPVELMEVLTEEPAEAAALEEGDAEEEIQYVMMNIPYADFYEAEVDNEVPVDAFSSATLNKTRTSSLVGGSYHVNSDGSDITGITYPVKLGEGVDLSAYKKLTDSDSVTISVTNRGQTSTTTYTGVDALFESDSYSYYVLSEEPSYYKELTVNEDGSLSFGKVQGTETTLENVAAEFMTESSYGDYQLNVDGLTLGSDTKVYGVVVQTDKNSYGLRHMENIWRQTNLSWATGFTTNVHGCPTSSEHYKAMMGQTITGLVYYTSEGIYNITLDESVYVPVKFEYALEVENASVSAGTAKVTVSGLPADFDAQYSVEGLEGVEVSDGALTYTASSAKNGKYTLTVTDAGNVYAPISADFELYADEMPAAYDEAQKAIVAASGATAEDLAAYLANITSVSVNGKSYAASGRGSVEIISADGTVKTDAAPIAEDGTYELVVSATGYQPLTFTYSKGETADVQYVMMNIPYADFYEAEVDNEVPVDAFSSATLNKTRTSSLVGGSYHVNSDGSDITGITYPVKLGEGVDLSAYKKLTDSDSVTISVTNRGQTSTTTYTGVDALFESDSYSYYVLSEEPSYYKELTVNEDGSLSFGKAQGTETTLANVAAEFMTKSSYGDYQLNVDGLTLESDTKVYGVVVQTDKNSYGLRHMENIWRQTNLSWATGFTTNVHGCPTSSEHYKAMMGQTITGLVYYTSEGIYNITLDESVYVPVKFEYALEVENASVSAGTAKVTVSGLPADFDAQYSVEGLEGVEVSDGALTYTASSAKNGKYTLTVTDAGNVYAPISTEFELYADEMPAAYDEAQKAIVAASGVTAEDLAAYLANITSVSVNGKSYAASGRGAVVIINADGTVKTDAAPIAEDGTYELVVSATGYQSLTFTYTAGEAEYRYVYAGLSWSEYWANEAVYNAGSAASSSEADAKGELDKGAFDTVSRATTNHGLHRGSYQCSAQITLKDGTKLDVAYYTGQTEGVLTNGEPFSYAKSDIESYVVTGIKYVPVKVASADYEAFKEKYAVVENGGALSGGYSEQQLQNYTGVIAEVTENTNGLKTAVKNEDGSFSFSGRVNNGSDSGLKDAALKKASDGIVVTVKAANGSYGEFLRVDLTGEYGDLAANMQAVEWTYYGDDSTYTNALQSYGTKFAADNWMHKSMGIQLGLTDSLRCQLPEGTDGTGYWTLTVYALGYEDYTIQFQATDENIVKPDTEEVDTTALEAAVKEAEALTESDYTAESWANLQVELQEAKDELANVHTQATVNEAAEHLNAAIKALVKAEVKVDVTALQNAIKAAEALKSADYTAESWAKVQTALTAAKKTLAAPGTQAAADASAKQLTAAVQALVKAEQPQKPAEPEKPAVGTVSTYNNVQYKVTGTNTVVAAATGNKSVTSVKIPATVTINGQKFNVTSVSSKAFYGCKKLKTVEISKNVTTIGSSAFENCTALTKVTGCSGVTTVGSKAFSGCSKLATVKGFTKVTSIGTKAFYNCKKLTAIGSKSSTITLAKVKTIGNNAFQNCKAVKKVNLTSTALTKIGVSAFQGCTTMTSFTSKSTKLASIGKNAFYGDSKLATVSLKTSKLTKAKVGSNAFKKIKSTCTFKVPSKKISSYKTILKARGAGSKIKVKKL